jgi:RNA polymerase sigma factor (sigma-70 family)
MPANQMNEVLQHLRRAGLLHDAAQQTDRQLLASFVGRREPAALEALVRRHGPLVWGVCRRVLGHAQDAEDAFQATFLVLARKAGSIRSNVGSWLYRVAHRTALKARAARAKRQQRERQVADMPEPAMPEPELWEDLQPLLDQEVNRLPDKYQAVVVLCDLEGKTGTEAARHLGLPQGTVRSRLARARALLAQRLARHGLAVSGGALAGVLAHEAAAATVPPAVMTSTFKVLALAAGQAAGGIAVQVAALTEGMVQDLVVTRLKTMALVVLAAGVVATGLGLAAHQALTNTPTKPARGVPLPNARLPGEKKPHTDLQGDPLPPGAVVRFGTRRFQVSTSPVMPVSVSRGRAYLVYHPRSSGGSRAEFRWLEARTGKVIDAWPLPTGRRAAGVSPDGRWAVLTGEKVLVKTGLPFTLPLYDLTRKRQVKVLRGQLDQSEGNGSALAGCFSADGKWLATVNGEQGRAQGPVRLWKVGTGKQVWTSFPGLNGERNFEPLGFTPGNAQLVLRATQDSRIYGVDTARGKVVRSFPTLRGSEWCHCAALAPDGAAVVMATGSAQIRRWDVKTAKERPPLTGHKEVVWVFAFAPEGKTLVSGGADPYVLVRDWPSGKVRRRLELGRGGAFQTMFVSSDGRTVNLLFWWEKTLHRYHLTSGKPLALPATHWAEVDGVAATRGGSIVSFGRDNVVRTWDLATGRQTRHTRLDPRPWYGTPFALSPNGKLVAAVDYSPARAVLFDRQTGKAVRMLPVAKRMIERLVFSPGGRFLAAGQLGRARRHIQVLNATTGKTVADFPTGKGDGRTGAVAFAFSPDGRSFAATADGRVRFWRVNGWKPVAALAVNASGLGFSPDGRMLACAGLADVTVWEVATGKLRAKFLSRGRPSHGPLFSAGGRFLAWTTAIDTVEAWDVFRGKRVAAFRGHDGPIKEVTFTRNGRRLVTASADCTLLGWDVAGAGARLPGAARPTEKDLHAAWDDLASPDGEKAFAAVQALSAAPDLAVALIRARLRPAPPLEAALVRRLLADLDSNRYAVRKRAAKKLQALGDRAKVPIREFLAAKPSAEARRWAEKVLKAVTRPVNSPALWQQLRAVEVLVRAGTGAARDVLKHLAGGAPGARLTREARAALARLGNRR